MVLIEHHGHRADVVLNRPDKRNALIVPMMAQLRDAFLQLTQDDSVRVSRQTGRFSGRHLTRHQTRHSSVGKLRVERPGSLVRPRLAKWQNRGHLNSRRRYQRLRPAARLQNNIGVQAVVVGQALLRLFA